MGPLLFELLRLKMFVIPAAILDKLVPLAGEASLGL